MASVLLCRFWLLSLSLWLKGIWPECGFFAVCSLKFAICTSQSTLALLWSPPSRLIVRWPFMSRRKIATTDHLLSLVCEPPLSLWLPFSSSCLLVQSLLCALLSHRQAAASNSNKQTNTQAPVCPEGSLQLSGWLANINQSESPSSDTLHQCHIGAVSEFGPFGSSRSCHAKHSSRAVSNCCEGAAQHQWASAHSCRSRCGRSLTTKKLPLKSGKL